MARMSQKRHAHYATTMPGLENGAKAAHPWLEDADKVPGWQWWPNHSHRVRRKASVALGFHCQSFSTEFLETLRWDTNSILVYLGERDAPASPPPGLGGRGKGRRCHWGLHPRSGFGTVVYRQQGYYKDIC